MKKVNEGSPKKDRIRTNSTPIKIDLNNLKFWKQTPETKNFFSTQRNEEIEILKVENEELRKQV